MRRVIVIVVCVALLTGGSSVLFVKGREGTKAPFAQIEASPTPGVLPYQSPVHPFFFPSTLPPCVLQADNSLLCKP